MRTTDEHRMLRRIIHLDADAFFASVEQAADARLRGRPVAVGGEKRGIIASASYEARRFGIVTPMPTARARKLCPGLIVLPGDFEKYERFSRWMFSYAYDFTPAVEITSIDEGYLDLSGARQSPLEIAQSLREAIRQALKITVSEGLGSNKLVSQIASKLHKPGAFVHVPHGQEIAFLHPLPNRWLPGVGPKTAERLNAAGLACVRHLAATPLELLGLLVGHQAPTLKAFANGIDERPILPADAPAKSYSQQQTFAQDQTDEEFIEATLRRMTDHLMVKVREDAKSIRTVTLKVRYNDLTEDQGSESLAEPTDLESDVYARLRPLLRAAWKRRVSLRMVSLKFSNVYAGILRAALPLDREAQQHDARRRLAAVVDELRRRRGAHVVMRGHDLALREASAAQRSDAAMPTAGAACRDLPLGDRRGPALEPDRGRLRLLQPRNAESAAKLEPPGPGGAAAGRDARGPFPTVERPAADASSGRRHSSRIAHSPRSARAFVPLAARSYYSFLNSTLSPEALVALARQHGLPAVALCDLGNLHGAVAFVQAARAAGLKPILGAEIQVEGKPLRLYVQNATGYANLCRLLSRAPMRSPKSEIRTPPDHFHDRRRSDAGGGSPSPPPSPAGGGSRVSQPVARLDRSGGDAPPAVSPLSAGKGRGEREATEPPAWAIALQESSAIRIPTSEDSDDVAAAPAFESSGCFRLSEFGLQNREGLLAISPHAEFAPFFPGRFYLDVTAQALAPAGGVDRPRPGLQTGLPCLVAPPIHYATPADRWKFDIVQSIRTLTLLRQAHPEKMPAGDFHFRAPAEMRALARAHPDALRHTLELAERCTFEFPFGQPQFPAFTPPDGSTPRAFLRHLVLQGLAARYGHLTKDPALCPAPGASVLLSSPSPIADGRFPISPLPSLQSQIEEELAIIAEVGYEEYFLIVWDILQECRRRNIEWITRGSAADSLVCYCLGISNVCPIRFDLYFRRFLNKERMALNKLPDIDIDFPHDRKDDVIELIFEKYGAEHCAVVGGFSTFQARSAFAEVAKVLGVAEREVRRFTEHFPWSFGSERTPPGTRPAPAARGAAKWEPPDTGGIAAVGEAGAPLPPPAGAGRGEGDPHSRPGRLLQLLQASPECRDLPLDEEPYRSALAMAEFLEGFPRCAKMHPCGVVLSRQPMRELTPTFLSTKGHPTTHFDMDAVEAVGLVKIDILAQGGLAVMRDVKARLRERGVQVDLERLVVTAVQPTEQEDGKAGKPQDAPAAGRLSNSRRDAASTEVPPAPCLSPAGRGEVVGGGWSNPAPSASSPAPLSLLPSPLGAPDPWTDPAVWDFIATGHARAVHHIESPAMVSLAKMCNVRDIDTLIALVSVIRPGAANEDKKREFTRRYQRLSPVTYPHGSLEPCLRSTFGLVVYEEHILQICEAFAGLPPGRADMLRRALVKEQPAIVAGIASEFAACARARGHPDDQIAAVWRLVAGFHGYAFCKAHSTAYGVEAYQSAWLKRSFPAEFMAAVLTHGKGFYHPLVYVLECWRLGVPLVGPWINQPGPAFAVVSEQANEWRSGKGASARVHFSAPSLPASRAIRVPVTRVKGLTERTQERLLAERARGQFESMHDFYRRVAPLPEELEALIRVGAFDGFGQPRPRQFWEARWLARTYGSDLDPAQQWLFPPPSAEDLFRSVEREEPSWSLTPEGKERRAQDVAGLTLAEPTRKQRLQWEVELLEFPASGHPLELYDDIAWETYCPVARLGEHVGQQVVTCGLVIEQRVHHQTNGEPMKFLTLADWTGIVETELFAATYKSYGLATVRHPVLEITATVEPFENGRGFSLRVQRAGKPRLRR